MYDFSAGRGNASPDGDSRTYAFTRANAVADAGTDRRPGSDIYTRCYPDSRHRKRGPLRPRIRLAQQGRVQAG